MAGPKYRKKLDKRKREIRDRKNYGQYGSGFDASRRAAEDKFLNRLGGFSIERGPRGNVLRYPGQDNQDLRYDAEYNLETSSPFGVWPQALSRGIPSAGYQKYVGMMGDDPEEKEKQDLILQGLEMQPKFSSYPLTRSDVGDIAFRTGDTGMYNTDAENWYYGKPTEGTMARANPLVQELTGTGDIPLYDIRRPEDIAYGYTTGTTPSSVDRSFGFKDKSFGLNPIQEKMMNPVGKMGIQTPMTATWNPLQKIYGWMSRGGIASLRR